MERRLISSGSPWEPVAGYSRAVRAGSFVAVAGTVAVNADGTTHAPGDAYAQAKRALEIIEQALAEAGATLAHVVRTRMFVTDISRFEEFARAHGEAFGEIRPATSMIEVRGLVGADMLIEIEADAIVG
jgi:enamine deaminase RidA (YjgF/YER057c/UK114 family)